MVNSVGIVLRKAAGSRYKISLLDKNHGRMECVVDSSALCLGSLVSYTFYEQRGGVFLRDVHVIYTPLSLGSSDLLFLHHILELLYYFAPVGSCVNGIFDLLAFLYTIEHMLISKIFKKFFLLKLLTFLGVSPELDSMRFSAIGMLSRLPIDQFSDDLVGCDDEKKLDKWLWHCIWQHPYVSEFKTVHFLEKTG
jgi:hypothetical protein